MKKTSILKRMLISVLAIAMVLTAIPMTTVTAQAAPTAVKKVVIKQGKKNVTKKTIKLAVGKSSKIKVVVTPSKAKKSIKYVSGNKKVATVSKSGKIKAKAAGTTKIKVTVTGKNKKKKTTWVKVKVTGGKTEDTPSPQPSNSPAPSQAPAPQPSVAPTPQPAPAMVNGSVQLPITNAVSSDPTIATVDATGKVTAGAKAGTVTITGKDASGNDVSYTVTVTNEDVAAAGKTDKPDSGISGTVKVEGVSIPDAEEVNLTVGDKTTVKAVVTPLKATNKKVAWTIEGDKKAVSIDSADGDSVVIKGLSEGKATLKVTTDDGGFYASIPVTVTDVSKGLSEGFTFAVSNDLKEYSEPAQNSYVYLTSQDASINIALGDKKGNPVGNRDVTLTLAPKYGNCSNLYLIDGEKKQKTVTTDADGMVTANLNLSSSYLDATATTNLYQSYTLTVKDTKDARIVKSAIISFGYLYLESPAILDTETGTPIVVGKNAESSNEDGKKIVEEKNASYSVEYATSQQVGKKLTFYSYPVLKLPATESIAKDKKYNDDSFAKKSGEYTVYNDETNEKTTTVIDTIPAGLEWANLEFNSIELSDYTRVDVAFYKLDEIGKDTKGNPVYVKTDIPVGKKQTITNHSTVYTAKSLQIPVQKDIAIYAVMSIVSAGQVNDNSNDGYDVRGIIGEYITTDGKEKRDLPVDNCVKWSEDEGFHYAGDDSFVLTESQMKKYLSPDKDENTGNIITDEAGNPVYTNIQKGYTYTYVVPAFPHVGNAVIMVRNQSNEDVAYYTYPIQMKYDNGVPQNVYEIQDPLEDEWGDPIYAVEIGTKEFNELVGNVEVDGNFVTVSSDELGVTGLHAQISIADLGVKEITNQDAYTSVQWAPYYEPQEEIQSTDFYALAGQAVTINAMLVDKHNSNFVTQNGQNLDITVAKGQTLDTFLESKNQKFSTQNGIVTFRVLEPNEFDYLKNLKATTEGYDVKLLVGNYGELQKYSASELKALVKDKAVDQADIHWIDAGLYFKASEDPSHTEDAEHNEFLTYDDLEIYNSENAATENASLYYSTYLDRKVGDSWIFGLLTIGKADTLTAAKQYSIGEISGVPVNFEKSGVGTNVAEDNAKGIYGITNETTGETQLTGRISGGNISDKVTITVLDENGEVVQSYPNVGEGDGCSINASVKLDIKWSENGLKGEVISPLGNQLASTTPTTIYLIVKDSFNNVLQGKNVKYSYEGLGAIEAEQAGQGTTDEDGLVAISLPAPGVQGRIKIQAECDGQTFTGTVNYSNTNAKPFTIEKAVADKATGTITMKFSNNINPDTLNENAFEFTNDVDTKANYKIANIKRSDEDASIVVIQLTDPIALSNVDVTHVKVTIKPYTLNKLAYQITDTDKQILTGDSYIYLTEKVDE